MFMLTSLHRLIYSLLASTLVLGVSTASGALIAQSYDFGTASGKTTAAAAGFSATTGGSGRTWSTVTDAARFTDSSSSGSYLVSTQTQSFPDLGTTPHFSIALDLTHVSYTEQFTRFGILALGTGGDTGYGAVITQSNGASTTGTTGLRILKGGLHTGSGVATLDNSALPDGTALFGVPLTLTLEGEYIGADLKLTFTATDGTNTSSISYTDTTPLTGDFAGFAVRSRDNFSGQNFVTDFDSFAIAPVVTPVPEPKSLGLAALAAIGLIGMLVRRRRK